MDVSISLDNPQTTFINGETIFGNVIINCPHNVTVSKITASLIGESVLTLTDKSGLFMDWTQQEKHRFVQESQVIAPYRYVTEDSRQTPMKLAFGYHSFWFALQVPETPECSCPRKSPVSHRDDKESTTSHASKVLPSSMENLAKGVEVKYRIDIAVNTVRNMFKFTTKQSMAVNIWPIDSQAPSVITMPPTAFPCVRATQASIMGPPPAPSYLPSDSSNAQRSVSIPTTAERAQILISASFLPECTLTRNRTIAMRLTIQKLNPYPSDILLQSFQMLLVGYTDICVGTTESTQMSSHTIQSLSNLNMAIFPAFEEVGMIHVVDSGLWEGKTLPGFMVPSFESCGLERRYELEVSMGFQCRGEEGKAGRVLLVQLRTPVRISSGIHPDRRLYDKSEISIGDEVSSKLGGGALQEYHGTADGFGYRDRGDREMRMSEHSHSSMPVLPPTYDEAVMMSPGEKWER
ncbi:hypothetical protein T440DRAFT_214905 [Plenodomus tracheiphilus IPT5]|uniref:Arrestin-like N-terminal domain-containing protein n=1 Tax=Plenodomus tracheiphilus IPT5 TaxID=1408161 RepID=A0A6A7AYS5_9PLEO|nr:hypothetical protein T440DRAFT_214905 [Plenodomus tracheiphilus IPT5]